MKLYASPLSPFSARARFSLYFKALPFEQVKPSTLGGMRSELFLSISPLGKIPVLEMDGGERIPESEVIVEYLEDMFPTPSLRPTDPERRARARLLARMADLYLIMPLLSGLATMMPIAGGRRPSPINPELVTQECTKLHATLDVIDRLMDANGPFALGDTPTTADGALTPILVFLESATAYFQRDDLMQGRRRIGRYLDEAAAAEPALARTRAEVEAALLDRRKEIEAQFPPA